MPRELPLGPNRHRFDCRVEPGSEPYRAFVEGMISAVSITPLRAFAATKAIPISQWFQRAESPFKGKIDRLSKLWQFSFIKAL